MDCSKFLTLNTALSTRREPVCCFCSEYKFIPMKSLTRMKRRRPHFSHSLISISSLAKRLHFFISRQGRLHFRRVGSCFKKHPYGHAPKTAALNFLKIYTANISCAFCNGRKKRCRAKTAALNFLKIYTANISCAFSKWARKKDAEASITPREPYWRTARGASGGSKKRNIIKWNPGFCRDSFLISHHFRTMLQLQFLLKNNFVFCVLRFFSRPLRVSSSG